MSCWAKWEKCACIKPFPLTTSTPLQSNWTRDILREAIGTFAGAYLGTVSNVLGTAAKRFVPLDSYIPENWAFVPYDW
jgi:hypothetical protein